MASHLSIYNKLSLVLWGAVLLAFVLAGAGLLIFHRITLEHRVSEIMAPYAQFIAVGADSAVAFQDPVRAQEILGTLRASPQILLADIYLDDGQLLASHNPGRGFQVASPAPESDGIHIDGDTAEWVQALPNGARLRLVMSLEQLSQQTRQLAWLFCGVMLVLLAATFGQLLVLRRTIVRPIASLTDAAERVRAQADYQYRVSAAGTDEVVRLGQSFNAMMAAIHQREIELRRLTTFQYTILQNAAHAIIATEPDGIVTSFNAAAERLLGYQAGEVIGQQTPQLWHDDKEIALRAQSLSEELNEAVSPGFDVFAARPRRNLSEEGEWTFVRKDGLRQPVHLSVTALRDEMGAITGYVGLAYDLTERKQAEEALRQSERRYRLVFENSPVPIWEEDFSAVKTFFDDLRKTGCTDIAAYLDSHPESIGHFAERVRVTDVNHSALVLHEAVSKEALLAGLVATFTPESFATFRQELICLWNGENSFQRESAVKTLSGRLRHVTVHLTVCPGYEDTLGKVLVSLINISERKQAEEALAERERQFRTLTENHPDGIVRFDTQGRHIYINAAARRISGTVGMPLLGKSVCELPIPGNPESTRPLLDALLWTVANRMSDIQEFRWPNGRIAEIRHIPEINERNEIVSVLAIARDITDRKRAEDRLKEYQYTLEDTVQQRTRELLLARDAAEAANKAKSIFLANMSHELRTPLNAILGFSGMMRRDSSIGDKQRETLDIINRSGEHLLNLINDVLEMAKIESGRLQLEISAFDLEALVDDVAQMMRVRAQEKNLQLILDRSADFPRYIRSDEARIRQILINLINNAVKFTLEGSVTIRLSASKNARYHLLIEIEDTGPGIAPEDRQRLFEPFVQLSDSGSQCGTGLGLTITRQFVRMLGGRISVDSTFGKGAVFKVDLPVELASSSDVAAPASMPYTQVIGLAAGQPRYRILIVEDQYENQLLLNRLMTELGLETKIAENGEQCLEVFKEWRPDLIWMDRRMPVMDGLEATKRLRCLPGGDQVKIVAVTASAFKEEQQEMLDAGMDGFVRKPYHFDEIYECLARQLGMAYDYRREPPESRNSVVLTPTMLAGLSAELRAQLKEALEILDSDLIDSAIGLIAESDAELGLALAKLAECFDYPSILKCLDAEQGAE
ncbi:MAG: PAS domain S-box protein [Methylomonas sp.]|nr:PAS domain S-box protein [Methylomonas sp.]